MGQYLFGFFEDMLLFGWRYGFFDPIPQISTGFWSWGTHKRYTGFDIYNRGWFWLEDFRIAPSKTRLNKGNQEKPQR